ncbi:histidine kinase N-terminal 7TM domain-containing protein [Bacillus sp. MRMR6]|uniref:histidine kinase N-terminal 7TM domain-containing diguanylate cyclase n=1 Tax=Bacillus sp. MRMR6 TaxID=1928617 RepID=UPI00095238F4|nr:histidine kinase N-terminal 7TM domain-containing protein [Bacillus sp. MRMR6]OLS40064.1 sensor domain-containing diguanylate cyclase [Bacillus sp. MRMR6]
MPYQLVVSIIVVSLAGILSLGLCLFAQFKLRDAPGSKYYVLITLLSTIFTFAYVYELRSTSLEQIKFWLNIEYLVMPFIPVFVLMMSLEFVGHRLKPFFTYLLFLIPMMTIFMQGTNDHHHFHHISIEVRSDTPFPIAQIDWGPWFYVHSIFLFLCLMISIIVLLMEVRKAKHRFRMQILLMAAGILTPIIANYFYINGQSPYNIDLGPISMSLSFVLQGSALIYYQMFNVTPIARDRVFESMREGVVVVNQNGVIVDYNPAVKKVMTNLTPKTIGMPIIEVVSENGELAEIICLGQECDFALVSDENGAMIHYHIQFSSVKNNNHQDIGKMIMFDDVTERVLLQEKLKELACFDGLTQVYNRTFFIQEAERMLEVLRKSGGDVSIIMFDIDHFKSINDSFGHEAGDRVLADITGVAKECIRSRDIVGRYGGEEFILFMPDTASDEAWEIAENIRLEIADTVFNEVNIKVTASFGIASTTATEMENDYTIKNIMNKADQALYTAKRNGRNCVKRGSVGTVLTASNISWLE